MPVVAPEPAAPQQSPQATQVDPDALRGFVKNLVYNERAETAAEQFWREFPDIASDNYLRQMAEATNGASYDASDPKSITKVFTAVVSNF